MMDTPAPTAEFKHTTAEWFKGLQDRICAALEETDGKAKFEEDAWERPGGGGGRTRLIRNGNILVKGGVNFSAVHGKTPQKILDALKLDDADFFATGVSIVLHPDSPMVPICHANVRYFEMSNGVHWFGGGIDLTPHYVVPAQARWFHEQMKKACDAHHPEFYARFKPWADEYFFLKHRNETRGVGGIFFDHMSENEEMSRQQIFAFVQEVGNIFAPTYTHLMSLNAGQPFGEAERYWQKLRRSRYVEFNLLFDKGTKFGIDTNGRTESILMSMPPEAAWEYNFTPDPGTKEAETLAWLKKDIDWLNV